MGRTEAYVLVQTSAGRALGAAEEIRHIAGVEAADPVTGLYDVICRVQAESLDELAATVVGRIQGVDGVERTETALVVHSK